jgi:hypothetical protein
VVEEGGICLMILWVLMEAHVGEHPNDGSNQPLLFHCYPYLFVHDGDV